MVYKATLVCEGGAMLGVYTAGILDVFLENDIIFDHAIGVSIGAGTLICYSALQKNRAINCMAIKDKDIAYVGFKSLVKKRQLFDYDLCYEGFGDLYVPFDYDAFAKSPVQTEVVVTDFRTGKPAYIKCVAKYHQVMDAARASGTLPIVSKPFPLEGIECLDGGIADPIPLERAKSYGNDKIVIIMTKIPGFRKEVDDDWRKDLLDRYYKDYPPIREALDKRAKVYNQEADLIDILEKEGKIFVFRPYEWPCSRIESDYDKLRAGYAMGVNDAKVRINELLDYLNK